MANHWKETTLGEVVEIIDGDRGRNYPQHHEFSSNGYCLFLNTKNVPNYSFSFDEKMFITKDKDSILRKGKLKRGDFVLTTRGTVGNFAFYSEKIPFENIRINSGMVVLRAKDAIIDRGLLNFYLKSHFFNNQVFSLSSGTAQPQLPIKDLSIFKILLPPLTEQKAISSILSSFDDKIELLRWQNKTLEAIAQTIFKEWFIEFKVNGKKQKVNSSTGLPEEWRIGKYGELVDVTTGKGLKQEFIKEKGKYSVLGANGELGKTDNYLFDEDLILTGRVGTLGTIYISRGKTWISDNVLISKPLRPENFYFVYFNLKRFNFESLNRGSTQPLITQTDLKNVEIIIPQKGIIESWHNVVSSLFSKIYNNNTQIQPLSKLRDTLLSKLMKGEIRIKL
jgi:type I restriction enzyme S subunit